MIDWMQKHHRWLVITIWISTIAFIGAGFFGWGQYSYASKSGSVAKVGNVKITYAQFNDAYSQMFEQYKKLFHGHFDKAQAKAIGLKPEVLSKLIDQALILNLAQSYHLTVSDDELYNQLTSQKMFYKNGKFSDTVYKALLANNNLTPHKYESTLRREMLIQKVLHLFITNTTNLEKDTFSTIFNIQDKILYKVLRLDDIKVHVSQKELKNFWEKNKHYFLTEPSFKISYIVQQPLKKSYTQKKIMQYYDKHKMSFTAKDGKILSLDKAKDEVIKALNKEATKIAALETFISFKKDKLPADISLKTITINQSKNPFTANVLIKINSLTPQHRYLKPQLVHGHYMIIRLDKKIPSHVKTFALAKLQVLKQYTLLKKQRKLLSLANKRYKHITNGITSPFVTIEDISKLKIKNKQTASKFLTQLFQSKTLNGYIVLSKNKIVIYNILAQKLLHKKQQHINSDIDALKQQLLEQNLIKALSKRFKTKIYLKGF